MTNQKNTEKVTETVTKTVKENVTENVTNRKSKKLLIAGIIIALLAVAGAVAYAGVQGGWFKGALFEPIYQTTPQDFTLFIPTYYVDISKNVGDYARDELGKGTKEFPYLSIREAVDKLISNQSVSGTIYVAKGTYNESVTLNNFTNIQLLGGYDTTFTTQNTESNQTVLNGIINGTNIGGKISGITFKNYENDNIFINIVNTQAAKQFEVSKNYFQAANTDSSLIKVTSMTGGKGTIKENKISASLATIAGIDSAVGGETIIEKNIFYASKSNGSLIKAVQGTTVKNNLISRTAVGNKFDIQGNKANIVNNTIYLDENSTHCIVTNGSSKVYNNIIYSCSGVTISQFAEDDVKNNGVWPESSNTGYMDMTKNYKCDPKFVGPTYTSLPTSFKLGDTSTCLNKGFTTPLVTDDYFGTTRPQGASTEIGFFESPFIFTIPEGGLLGGEFTIPLAQCGNGTKEGTEACDDGDTQSGDGCSATCTVETGWSCTGTQPSVCTQTTVPAVCGNNTVEAGEVCDDGNTTSGDGCNSTCTAVEPDLCTNIANNQYTVPSGYTAQGTICIKCGDGKKEGTEACDDGDTTGGDGCRATCTLETGWTCIGSAPSVCTQNTATQVCGNNMREGTEQCDDGNNSNLDACTNNCVNAVCGDNYKRTGVEQCDDGNTSNGDGCSSNCQTEQVAQTPVCGNGVKESGEECDDGDTQSGDGCSASCRDEEVVTPTEEFECGEWTDVSESDPEYGIWVWECQRGILRGYPDGTLSIENKLNRAELLALAFRAAKYEGVTDVDFDLENCFNDGRGEWYEPYACTGKDEGFIVGYPGNVFRGANTVILAEGLKMFLGALGRNFSIDSDPWFYDMVWDAHLNEGLPYSLRDENDIIPVGTLELTRRRAVNMLYRLQIM